MFLGFAKHLICKMNIEAIDFTTVAFVQNTFLGGYCKHFPDMHQSQSDKLGGLVCTMFPLESGIVVM